MQLGSMERPTHLGCQIVLPCSAATVVAERSRIHQFWDTLVQSVMYPVLPEKQLHGLHGLVGILLYIGSSATNADTVWPRFWDRSLATEMIATLQGSLFVAAGEDALF